MCRCPVEAESRFCRYIRPGKCPTAVCERTAGEDLERAVKDLTRRFLGHGRHVYALAGADGHLRVKDHDAIWGLTAMLRECAAFGEETHKNSVDPEFAK